MATSFNSRVSVSNDVMIRQVGEESVLLNLKTEQYLGLDDVSTRVWQALASSVPIQSACEALLDEFDVEPARLRQDLDEFVQELIRLELVEVSSQP